MLITSLNPEVHETLKELISLKLVFAFSFFLCLIMIASEGMMTFDNISTKFNA